MKRISIFLFVLLCLATAGRAQMVEARAVLSNTDAVVGEAVRLVVAADVVVGVDEDEPKVDTPTGPVVEGLAVRYVEGGHAGTSRQITIINGQRSGSLTHTFRYFWEVKPDAAGRYRLPPIDVKVGGKGYRTNPTFLTVHKDAPGNRYVGVAVVANTTTPYVNQPVRLRYQLTTERTPVKTRRSYPRLTIPWAGSPNGFKALPLPERRRLRQGLGVQLNNGDRELLLPVKLRQDVTPAVLEISLDKTLIPLAPGRIDLGGTSASLEVARATRDGGILRGVEYIDRSRAVVTTEPIILDVRDAPESGRPESYRGMLGDFDVTATFGKGEIRAGDGVTLNLVCKGSEVLDLIEEPKIDDDFPDCRVLPSGRRMEGEGASRTLTFSWLIKPLSDEMKELPRFDYSWFRPSSETFETATAGPLPLTITGKLEEESVFDGGARSQDQIAIDILGEGVRPLLDEPGTMTTEAGGSPVQLFIIIALLPVLSLAGTSLLVRRKQREAGDESHARRRRASREATARLEEARALLGQRGFYGKLSRSLAGFVADKVGAPPASVSAATAASVLAATRVPSTTLEALSALLNELDMKEFGGGGGEAAEQQQALARVEELIGRLDKEIRA